MSFVRLLLLGSVLFVQPVLAAYASGGANVQACKAMAATFPGKEAEIAELKTARDTAAATVETAGDTWQEAEVHSRASEGHAARAKAAQAAFSDAKKLLARQELSLQATVNQFNTDIAAYNDRCAR